MADPGRWDAGCAIGRSPGYPLTTARLRPYGSRGHGGASSVLQGRRKRRSRRVGLMDRGDLSLGWHGQASPHASGESPERRNRAGWRARQATGVRLGGALQLGLAWHIQGPGLRGRACWSRTEASARLVLPASIDVPCAFVSDPQYRARPST